MMLMRKGVESAAPGNQTLLAGGVATCAVLISSMALVSSSPAWAEERNIVETPKHAAAIWIDVEESNLTPDMLSGALDEKGVRAQLEFAESAIGLTAIVDRVPESFSLSLSASSSAKARVAITFVARDGAIIAGTSDSVMIAPGGETTVTPPQLQFTADSAVAPGEGKGASERLPRTGADAGWLMLLALSLTAVGSIALMVRRKGQAAS